MITTQAKLQILSGLILAVLCSFSHASDMFGNPSQIGNPGTIGLQFGGGTTDLYMNASDMVATTTVGNIATTRTVSTLSLTDKEDVMFAGVSFAPNSQTELSVTLGSGRNTGQKTNSRSIGMKLSPGNETSKTRLGLMLRAQRVKTEISGDFYLAAPYNSVNDGINVYTINFPIGGATLSPLHGSEKLEYSRLDAFLGIGGNTGSFRPYGGFALTRISGTDSIALSGNTSVSSWPVGGGAITTSNQNVTFSSTSSISNSKIFSIVVGFSAVVSDNANISMEYKSGAQESLMLSGDISF
ncbi:MAG: hypothetical protein HZB95_03985 [Nitrosomonadales bacterium]|nr:hypothetical protein [Nitrosomonadales bacterium]